MNALFPDPLEHVIAHSPADTKCYLGSPSIVRAPDGALIAAHDFFGPGSSHDRYGRECAGRTYRSEDEGETWQLGAELQPMFWSSLFVHEDALYLLGTSAEYGDIVIRRSTDGGRTWTHPADERSGLLFAGGAGQEPPNYHCAPTPVLVHQGRIWRAFEDNNPCVWPRGFRSCVISAPEDADLLRAESWRMSNKLPYDPDSDPPAFGITERGEMLGNGAGWLEGNVVADRDGRLWNILRVHSAPVAGIAAMVQISADGALLTFDPESGFIDFPGGMTKFTIRHDPVSDRYWTLSNNVTNPRNASQRSMLSLHSSADLRALRHECTLLADPEDFDRGGGAAKSGFQYVDWQFDNGPGRPGTDIVFMSRTAYRGAHNFHDANYMTFHRLRDFRHVAN